MANEEQRRAFASYMGRSAASGSNVGQQNQNQSQGQGQGQPIPQYPGSVAQPGNLNPYLFNVYQFPGLGVVPPAAPTPPPAAPSSVASLPGYQGGFPQAGYGYAQGVYGHGHGQNGIQRRPPPLSAPLPQQQMPAQAAGVPEYGQVPGNYNAQHPPPQGYNASWQDAELERRRSGAPAGASVVPVSRNTQQEIVESRQRQTNEQFHYQQSGQSQRNQAQAPPPQVEEVAVPVMLCHTCSHCGQMRSAGFHRNNPVVPGKPLVPSPCRRCKKKIERSYRSSSKYTRIRKCTSDEPCDWPREPFHIDIDNHERSRGRRRIREDVYTTRYSPSRPRVIRREYSPAQVRVQQPPQDIRAERQTQTSSSSTPRPSSRYTGGILPPPDVVRMKAMRPNEVYSAPPGPLPSRTSRSNEVWPPPDVVPTHSYRKVERSTSRRASSRIIELSPSPPPPRSRPTRVIYRSESQERRPRSPSLSPVRVSFREERRSEEAEARLMSHPRPFRSVVADHRTVVRLSDETSSNTDSMSRRRVESPHRRILKPADTDHETDFRRRTSMRESQQSTRVEVGGPRVHFSGGPREEPAAATGPRGGLGYAYDRASNSDNYAHYRDYSRHRYAPDPPSEPPAQDFERIRIRHSSPSPQRQYEDEISIDRQRRLSPSPPHYEEEEQVRIRHSNTSPLPIRRRTPRPPPSPPSLEQPAPRPLFRHVSRPSVPHRRASRSSTPPPPPSRRRTQDVDHTDSSESVHSGDITEVRSWRGIDENGRPATFVEERRTVGMIDQGSERGGGALAREYWKRGRGAGERERERVGGRGWRDV
ncbi:hypothetical protein BDW02DRAFT_645320 [Decorospora gaudefroyi]|uniref:Uncharacterized protein n=1 Tax=Decorospora gaudefroyi TaxID=184978 RepID=A0A6A5KQ88_9PLEO|nr:hypothetical protein BDW02DRAFT_645320 [Decorospora gaudefroyi]